MGNLLSKQFHTPVIYLGDSQNENLYKNEVPFKSKTPSLSKLGSATARNDNENPSFDEEIHLDEKIGLASTYTSIQSKHSLSAYSRDSAIGVGDVKLQSASSNNKFVEPDHFSSDLIDLVSDTPSEDEDENQIMSQTHERILFKKQQLHCESEKKQNDLIENLDLPIDDDVEEILAEPAKSPVVSIKSSSLSRKSSITSTPTQDSQETSTTPPLDKLPLTDPEVALKGAIHNLNSSQWTAKVEATEIVSRLALNHPNILLNNLHNLTATLLREVQNLRSSVSRAAIISFGDLFTSLKRNMETPDLDNICKVLLHKSGESSKFIQEDVEKTLICMVESINPHRAAIAVIHGGASHKNCNVRKLTSQLLADLSLKIGANKLLNSKELTNKIIPTAAIFLSDSSPLTRYYGRIIFHLVIFNTQFESVLQKTVQPNVVRNIRNILDGIKSKGVGAKPKV